MNIVLGGGEWKPRANKRELMPSLRKAGNVPDMKTHVPQAVPSVDLAVVQVVLLPGVEHKFAFMGAIFLNETKTRFRESC